MVHFAVPPVGRDQLTLFTEKLDDIIDDDHPVRLLDDILEKIDWTAWENSYVLTRGQPRFTLDILLVPFSMGS